MKKKVLFIIIAILLIALIAGGIVIGLLLNKTKSTGSKWGDTYYAYLSEAVKEKDLKEADEKYGIKLNMKDAKLQFCEVEDDEVPAMIMTYEQNDTNYVNVYQIGDDDKVTFISYKQPTEAEFLYNIEKDDYAWYIHKSDEESDSYSSLKNIVKNLKENSKQSDKSKNVNIAELEADYTISKEEAKITQEVENGEKLTIDKFDTLFVRPEVELNDKFDFDVNISDKDLKKAMSKAVDDYKTEGEIVTKEIKEKVEEKAEETKEIVQKIEKAKENASKKQDNNNGGVKVGNNTLKYGTYISDVSQMDKEFYGTITLEPNGKFHIKSNYDEYEGTIKKINVDCDGTYEIKLNQPTGYPGDYANYINFKPETGKEFSFEVYKDNAFSDQWHGYNYSSSSTTSSQTNSSSNNTKQSENSNNTKASTNVPSGIDDVYKEYIQSKEYEKYTKTWAVKATSYCMYDIDQDGQKELLIGSDNDGGWQYVQINTYDKSSKKVVEVANIYAYGGLRYSKSNKQIVYTEVKPFQGAMGYGFYELKNNKLVSVKTAGSDDINSYFVEEAGKGMKHISADECNAQFEGLIYFEYTKF